MPGIPRHETPHAGDGARRDAWFRFGAGAEAGGAGAGALDAVSIRLNTSGSGNNSLNIRPGGTVVAVNQTPVQLLLSAYRLQPSQLAGGPEWLHTDRYDLTARSSSGVQSREVLSAVLRQVFAERFRLMIHVETRELPVYALWMARTDRTLGSRMQVSPVGCAHLQGSPAVQGGDPAPGRPRCTMSTGQSGPATTRIVGSGVDMPLEPDRAPVAVTVIDTIARPTEN